MESFSSILRITSVLAISLVISSLTLSLAHDHHGKEHVGNGTDDGKNTTETAEGDLNFNEVRYHAESQKYYRVGSTEPCLENMRFFAVPNETRLGQCDCDYYQCSRPLLYNEKTGKCHLAWSRGPCNEGEWYTFTEDLKPICENNVCPESPATETANYFFKNPKDGKCYQAGTQGYCGEDEGRLMIYPFEPIPVCRTATVCYPLSVPIQQLCIQGNRRHHDGLCQSEF